MWNFTGRGVLIPNTNGLSDLFDDEETAAKSQKDLNDITFDDISLQFSHEHSELRNEWKEHYFLDCLFDGLNVFPKTMNMHDLDEKSTITYYLLSAYYLLVSTQMLLSTVVLHHSRLQSALICHGFVDFW